MIAVAIAAWIGGRLELVEKDLPFPGGSTWHFGAYQTRMIMLTAIGVIMSVSLQLINGISGQFSLGHAGFMAVGAYLSGYASVTYGALDHDDPATNFQNVGEVFWYFICLALLLVCVGLLLWLIFLAIRQSRHVSRALPPVLLLAVLAWFTWDFSAGFYLDAPPGHLIWTHLISGLGRAHAQLLHWGLEPAHALSVHLPAAVRRPLCFIALLSGGGFFAAAAGLLVGLPTLRLRGDYLAIATLGFAEILRVVFTNSQALGGATGLSVQLYSNVADPDRDPVAHRVLPWIGAMMALSVVCIWRLAWSPKGRLIRAVREDEIAAAAVGVNTTRQKVTAFIVGAFFAGIGGALYVHCDGSEGYVNPDSFGIDKSLLFVVMVTLGGLGSISGAILAGAVLTLLPFLFRQLASDPSLPRLVRSAFDHQLALFALALVAMMLVRPKGLLGGRELWWRRRRGATAAPIAPPDPAPLAAMESRP